jgi:hypothetical protein
MINDTVVTLIKNASYGNSNRRRVRGLKKQCQLRPLVNKGSKFCTSSTVYTANIAVIHYMLNTATIFKICQ